MNEHKPIDLNQRLSQHFTLAEMVASGTAIRKNIDNTPQPCHVESLGRLCREALEPLRRRFGALRVTSGYRCPELNRAVGGAHASQHLRGEAADIHVASDEAGLKMMAFAKDNIDFDQLILERSKSRRARWLHVSYRSRRDNRREAFAIDKK